MVEFRVLWDEISNLPYREKFQEPVYTHWEYIGTTACQFIQQIDGLQSLAVWVINTEKVNF